MARQPGGSIPQLFLHRYDVKAAYTLLERPEATPQRLQAGHQSLVKARLQTPGTYLLLEDSTELGWTRVHPVEDLASIGNLQSDQCRGFLLHTTLAVRCLRNAADDQPSTGRPAVEVLGIADQEYLLKKPRPPGEKVGDVRSSQKRADRLSTERQLTTTGEVILAVGRLGGHMNRKSDGLPGWQTLWRGMARLTTLVEGYRLGRSRFGE